MAELFASVDLGGTNIACVFADSEGQIVQESKVPTMSHLGPEGVIDRIAALVNDLSRQVGTRPAGLGIGIPGLADIRKGQTRFLPNMPGNWIDVPLRDLLAPKIGCPVYLLNDARQAALGEQIFGQGRDVESMVFFTLGTGIGGGVVVDGKLRLGPLGAAGEIGHLTILPNGPQCGCGSRGCLETLFSGPAITAEGVRLVLSGQAPVLHDIVDGDISKVNPREMARAAAAGDEAIRDAIIQASLFLGIGVSNIIGVLHPELVVLGGGVAGIGDLMFETVRRTVRDRVRMIPTEDIQIKPSMLGDKAGALGGIALAMQRGFIE